MKRLQRHHDYDIDSYLSEDNNCSAYLTFKEETVELVEKYFGNSINSDVNETSVESPCEGEKVSLFHTFMKDLQLLDILHTAWLMMSDINKVSNVTNFYIC